MIKANRKTQYTEVGDGFDEDYKYIKNKHCKLVSDSKVV